MPRGCRQATGQQQGRHGRDRQPQLLQQDIHEHDRDGILLNGLADLGEFHRGSLTQTRTSGPIARSGGESRTSICFEVRGVLHGRVRHLVEHGT
jgi:hypothetical protein